MTIHIYGQGQGLTADTVVIESPRFTLKIKPTPDVDILDLVSKLWGAQFSLELSSMSLTEFS